MHANSLDSLYVGDPMLHRMGLLGLPFLCTLGRPYIRGGEEKAFCQCNPHHKG